MCLCRRLQAIGGECRCQIELALAVMRDLQVYFVYPLQVEWCELARGQRRVGRHAYQHAIAIGVFDNFDRWLPQFDGHRGVGIGVGVHVRVLGENLQFAQAGDLKLLLLVQVLIASRHLLADGGAQGGVFAAGEQAFIAVIDQCVEFELAALVPASGAAELLFSRL